MGASGSLYGYVQFAQIHQGACILMVCVLFCITLIMYLKNALSLKSIILNLVSMPEVLGVNFFQTNQR